MKPLSAALNTTQPVLATSSAWAYPGYALFFLMLFVPTVYQPIKAILILIVLLTIALKVYRDGGRINLHPSVLFWTWLLTAVGLFFIIRGLTRGAPGALRVSTVHVIWPWLYLVFIAGSSTRQVLHGLFRVMIGALLAIDLYSLHYILYEAGLWPRSLYIELDQGQAIGFYAGFVEYNLYSVSTLLFLVPFGIAALLIWPHRIRDEPKASADHGSFKFSAARKWLFPGVLLGLLLALLSGRRALMLCVAITPVITLFLKQLLPRDRRTTTHRTLYWSFAILLAPIFVLFFYAQKTFDLDLEAIWLMLKAGFDFLRDPHAGARADQFEALLEGWRQNPLLGSGLGASADVLRSEELPWAYELYYVSTLFHTGLIGTAFYATGIAWIYYHGLRIIRAGRERYLFALPVLVGTTCFLIATATNPYLGKYDYIWVLFLPILLINFDLLGEQSSTPRAEDLHL